MEARALAPRNSPFPGLPDMLSVKLTFSLLALQPMHIQESRQLRGPGDPDAGERPMAAMPPSPPARLLPVERPNWEAGHSSFPGSSTSICKRGSRGPQRRMVALRSYGCHQRSWREVQTPPLAELSGSGKSGQPCTQAQLTVGALSHHGRHSQCSTQPASASLQPNTWSPLLPWRGSPTRSALSSRHSGESYGSGWLTTGMGACRARGPGISTPRFGGVSPPCLTDPFFRLFSHSFRTHALLLGRQAPQVLGIKG